MWICWLNITKFWLTFHSSLFCGAHLIICYHLFSWWLYLYQWCQRSMKSYGNYGFWYSVHSMLYALRCTTIWPAAHMFKKGKIYWQVPKCTCVLFHWYHATLFMLSLTICTCAWLIKLLMNEMHSYIWLCNKTPMTKSRPLYTSSSLVPVRAIHWRYNYASTCSLWQPVQ